MKNKEQIKQEIVNYLTKTSFHAFKSESGELFKVVNIDGKFYTINDGSINKVREINIDNYIDNFGNNAKCILKNYLFLNRKLHSVKNTRLLREYVNTICDTSIKKVLA